MNFEEHSPKTLQEAVDLVVADLRPEDREYSLKEGAGSTHHFFGRAMRNGWGLWDKKSPLSKHFQEVYGLGHADDMSGMILSAVDANVKGVPFSAIDEAQRYQKYWRNMKIDPLTLENLA